MPTSSTSTATTCASDSRPVRILGAHPFSHDEFAVEAIGSLGADLDDASAAFLRGIAADAHREPGTRLWRCQG